MQRHLSIRRRPTAAAGAPTVGSTKQGLEATPRGTIARTINLLHHRQHAARPVQLDIGRRLHLIRGGGILEPQDGKGAE